jgi:putative ABC transport system permease protein
MEALWSDIRYGLRALRRAPLFAASVALTIGIGLGILCSVFTVFNAYVLRPFPVDDPYSLYELPGKKP